MINLLKELVQLESPSSDKRAVDACSAFLADQLRKSGARVTRMPQKDIGDFHLAEYPAKGDRDLVGEILVLLHVDTVLAGRPYRENAVLCLRAEDFRTRALDMKAGLVIATVALRRSAP